MAIATKQSTAKIAARIRRMATVPGRAAISVAPLLQDQAKQSFANESDPLGDSWKADKPATYRLGTTAILFRTGKALAKTIARSLSKSVKISVNVPYMRFHFTTGRNPLPPKGVIPPSWKDIIKAQVSKAFAEIAAGG